MNRYPFWKNILICVLVGVSVLFALPNLYGENPALQVTATRDFPVGKDFESTIRSRLRGAMIEPISIEPASKGVLLRFADIESQLKARDILKDELFPNFSVTLSLAPAAPSWLRALGARPMHLGLDLRGGIHFMLETDMKAVIQTAEERFVGDLRSVLRENHIRYTSIGRLPGSGIRIKFPDQAMLERAEPLIADEFSDFDAARFSGDSDYTLDLSLKPGFITETQKLALQQNLTILRNRVNELGVAEPIIQQQGRDRVVVQLPGVQDTARAKEILGATATLEFHMVDESQSFSGTAPERAHIGGKMYRDRQGNPVYLNREVLLTGEYITDAASGIDQETGSPAVFITLDDKGGRRFSRETENNIGKALAVVFIEQRVEKKPGEAQPTTKKIEEVINVAIIRDRLAKRFQITGLDSSSEARDLALLLRAGALAAPMHIVEEQTIGPSLGQDNIDKGIQATIIGFALVLCFTAAYYGVFGLIAGVALGLNLIILVALMSLLQATLTLPGIAGIVLTVGMAVDANVLIFERIREELARNNSPQASIHAGYDRAIATIADSNITTLIAAIVLFGFGAGPIKGFAVTLSLGIITSMFTAIMVTRAIINLLYGNVRRLKKETLLHWQGLWGWVHRRTAVRPPKINFMGKRVLALGVSGILSIAAIFSFGFQGLNLGIDFTGGSVVEVSYDQPVELEGLREALENAGLAPVSANHFGSSSRVMIRLPSVDSGINAEIGDQLRNALAATGANPSIDRIEFIGPQVGDELTQEGALAMLYALFGILLYVAFRFQFRFSVGAIVATIHDVVIAVGVFSLTWMNFDLTVLAAMLALIGYSLNDTIVVFDRVRENFRKWRNKSPLEVVNLSINETLARTIVTGVTTLLVLVALYFFGGEVLSGFSLALIIGIFVGTYSSIYIASALTLALGVSRTDLLVEIKENPETLS
jgi:protein-export membrane protein SecD/preprotein translocase SecF subunit